MRPKKGTIVSRFVSRCGQTLARTIGRSILFLHRHAWFLIAVTAALVLALGIEGFREYGRANGEPITFPGSIYLAIQLFTLESGAVNGVVGWQLEVARFLAPIVATGAAVRALTMVFYDRFQLFLLHLFGYGHVVVCGLGNKGSRLVEQLAQQGCWVVVIEQDGENHGLARCRSLGATVLIGACGDEWVQRKARIWRAETLVLVTGEDGRNIEAAVCARRVNGQTRRPSSEPLRCLVHIHDPSLRHLLTLTELVSREDDPFEIEFFNAFQMTATVMMREAAAMAGPEIDGQEQRFDRHVCFVGCGYLGEAILVREALNWRLEDGASRGRLEVSVIDTEASCRVAELVKRHPQILAGVDFHSCDLEVTHSELSDAKRLAGIIGSSRVDAVYVCVGNDAVGLRTALSIARGFGPQRPPITVGMTETGGLTSAFKLKHDDGGFVEGVRAVGLLDTTCDAELVLGGSGEILARAIHEDYVRYNLSLGKSGGNIRPWSDLSEEIRESNRERVRQLPSQLATIKCELGYSDGEPILYELSDAETEAIACLEHERWYEERISVGWRDGEKDPKRPDERVSPYLIPWNDLDDGMKKYNRRDARMLPLNLAKAGREIRPKSEDP